MSIENKAFEAYEENSKLAKKYQVEDNMWMDWYTKGYRQAKEDAKQPLSEEQVSEKMVEYINSTKLEDKLKLGQYSLITISAMAIDANSAKTTLSSEFTHNGKRYEAKMLITQKEVKL